MKRPQPGRVRQNGTSARARLLERLHAAAGSGLISIQAPAGSGKTTLVETFVSEYDCDAIYVTLDEPCAVPEILAERILLELAPGRLRKRQLLALGDLEAQVVSHLRSEDRERPLVLVLEKLENLAGAPEAMGLVERLHSKLPAYTDLVLVGRSIPSVSLEDQASSGGGLWIHAREFGDAEHPPGTRAHGTDGRWSDHQERPIEDSVEQLEVGRWGTQLLERLPENHPLRESASQYSALAPDPESHARPATTGTVLAFPVPARGNAGNKSCKKGSESGSTMSACWALMEAGLGHHAAEFAVRSGDGLAAAKVLSQVAPQALREGIVLPIGRLAAVADSHASAAHSDALVTAILARVEAVIGDPSRTLDLVASLDFESEISVGAVVQALIGQATASRAIGEREVASAAANQLAAIAEGTPAPERVEAALAAGDHSLYAAGDLKRARTLYERASTLARTVDDRALLAQVEGKLGELAYTTGDSERAVESLRSSAEKWSECGRTARLAIMLNNLGVALAANGQIRDARTTLSKAVQAADAAGLESQRAYALASLGELECAFGSPEVAKHHLERVLALCSADLIEERLRALVVSELAHCEVRLGDLPAARRHAARGVLLAETSASPIDHASCLRNAARADTAEGDFHSAEKSLVQARTVLDAAGATAEAGGVRVQTAGLHFIRGQMRKASRLVRKAARDARRDSTVGAIMASLRDAPKFASWVHETGLLGSLLTAEQWETVEEGTESRGLRVDEESHDVIYSRALKRIHRDGVTLEWPNSRVRRLFEEFVANRDGVPEESLKKVLDPADPRHRGNTALRSALCQLERVLDRGAIETAGRSLRLNPNLRVRVA